MFQNTPNSIENADKFKLLPNITLRVYKKRWVMLGLFSVLSLSNAMMWITYAPIATSIREYYSVSTWEVNFMSLVYMIIYIPFVWIASWFLDTYGLRKGLILGAALNTVGSWLRFLALSPSLFWVAAIGQTVAALAQTFILGAPPKVAANWFGEHERTTATSIGALFNQVGIALGFIVPPQVVSNKEHIPMLMLGEAIFCTIVAVLVVAFFRGSPPTPPSVAAASEKVRFKEGLKQLSQDRSFLSVFFSFGIGVGAFLRCIYSVGSNCLSFWLQ